MDEHIDADDLAAALYVALDRLDYLDPKVRRDPWFRLIERVVDDSLRPMVEKRVKCPLPK